MNWHSEDTIAAISTAPGNGGIAIVRISGPEAVKILSEIFHPGKGTVDDMVSHKLVLGDLSEGVEKIDHCMAVMMRAPHSYTREDVVELQIHGGGYTAQRTLSMCLKRGARLAEAGEFTARAFQNGRVDLSQAEAVMSLIQARSDRGHQQAIRQLEGGTFQYIRSASEELYRIQAGLAACLDYPDEISDEEAVARLLPDITALRKKLENACDERRSRMVSAGPEVVLFGRPNVGKSSLLNALLGEERAIVTNIPGTTRDVVRGELSLGPDLFHLTDTAGMRDTDDIIERVGVDRSKKALTTADIALLVLDASEPLTEEDRSLLQMARDADRQREDGPLAWAILLNKEDLPEKINRTELAESKIPLIPLAATEHQSLEPLKAFLMRCCEDLDMTDLSQPRHLEAARRAISALKSAEETLLAAPVDLAATDLETAQRALAEITGDEVTEKLLDKVFSEFCVGK